MGSLSHSACAEGEACISGAVVVSVACDESAVTSTLADDESTEPILSVSLSLSKIMLKSKKLNMKGLITILNFHNHTGKEYQFFHAFHDNVNTTLGELRTSGSFIIQIYRKK